MSDHPVSFDDPRVLNVERVFVNGGWVGPRRNRGGTRMW
jgi:hypothetical protein